MDLAIYMYRVVDCSYSQTTRAFQAASSCNNFPSRGRAFPQTSLSWKHDFLGVARLDVDCKSHLLAVAHSQTSVAVVHSWENTAIVRGAHKNLEPDSNSEEGPVPVSETAENCPSDTSKKGLLSYLP